MPLKRCHDAELHVELACQCPRESCCCGLITRPALHTHPLTTVSLAREGGPMTDHGVMTDETVVTFRWCVLALLQHLRADNA